MANVAEMVRANEWKTPKEVILGSLGVVAVEFLGKIGAFEDLDAAVGGRREGDEGANALFPTEDPDEPYVSILTV